jgi:hypothetical protein
MHAPYNRGMTLETLRTMLNRRPFEAMRVKMSNGEVFEIRHPEMATLTKTGLIVVLPEANGGPSDRFEICSYLHIASVESTTASGPRLA